MSDNQPTDSRPKGIVWSPLYDLADFDSAPADDGIYVVGAYSGANARPVTGSTCSDPYLGQNWPDAFAGKMVGRAYKTTIRGRLKHHFEKSSNKHVRAYLKAHGDHSLSYIYIARKDMHTLADSRLWEHFYLSALRWEWNIHAHESKSFKAAVETLFKDVPGSDLADWWDPRDG